MFKPFIVSVNKFTELFVFSCSDVIEALAPATFCDSRLVFQLRSLMASVSVKAFRESSVVTLVKCTLVFSSVAVLWDNRSESFCSALVTTNRVSDVDFKAERSVCNDADSACIRSVSLRSEDVNDRSSSVLDLRLSVDNWSCSVSLCKREVVSCTRSVSLRNEDVNDRSSSVLDLRLSVDNRSCSVSLCRRKVVASSSLDLDCNIATDVDAEFRSR